ncbi:MAG: aminotransferase class V-fold PLP-dependent enzyme [Thermovirgaceae bacterium]|nr:aminotransferase class V-fold PLP-dependent enzyme [Thermovirgaceae bacterium]
MGLSLESIRAGFPVLEHTAYLDTATTGPFHRRIHAAAIRCFDQRLNGGLDMPGYKEWVRLTDEARSDIASVINARPEEIAYTKNASEGMNIAAHILPLTPGDNVIVPDLSFPSNSYVFMNLQKKGVEVKWARSSGGVVPFDEISRLVDGRTRAISVCHVEFASGFTHNLEMIGALCREKNIYFHVDCTQSIMALRIDVRAANIDMMSAAVYKWPCCPLGVGFFFCSERILEGLAPESAVGWFGMTDRWDMPQPPSDIPLSKTAGRFETGSPNFAGVFAMTEAARIYEELGPQFIEERILHLNAYLADRLLSAGVEVVGPFEEGNRSGILYARFPNEAETAEALRKNKVQVNTGHGKARIATHYFNTEEDIDRLVEALK